MPLIPGLLRRRGPSSDLDMRRHSFLSPDANSQPVLDGRASEQIPRRPSAAEFLTPSAAPAPTERSSVERSSMSADASADTLVRSISPPVQEETPKHRRFSMLKFRNASDSQLSSRARLHASQADAPPLPQRKISIPSAPLPLRFSDQSC